MITSTNTFEVAITHLSAQICFHHGTNPQSDSACLHFKCETGNVQRVGIVDQPFQMICASHSCEVTEQNVCASTIKVLKYPIGCTPARILGGMDDSQSLKVSWGYWR